MTSTRFLEFLFLCLLLLLHQVYTEEAEPVFRKKGNAIEMGYCFGVDFIVVYRSAPEGDQLLGNSSADSTPITPPADFKGRIYTTSHQQLLGLRITHLTYMDSGIYRRECWQNQMLVSQHTQKLSVCDEEIESEEITVKEEGGGAELLCNSTSIGLEGTSVRWYTEAYPSYKTSLFLDSSVSLDPLVEEMQGVVAVRDRGALLLLKNSLLKTNQHFYCLVTKDKNCLSFQNLHLPDHSESKTYFALEGERVVLNCTSDGNDQQWETPLGRINSSKGENQMYISLGEKSKDFSLVIPEFSDEYSGDYSCVSSSLEVQYLLVLCPKKESREASVFEGGNVVLDCDDGKDNAQRVQWHRQEPSGGSELIHDSHDDTILIPQDLRGRLSLSKNGSTLAISHLEVKDLGVYWCVVLSPEFLEEGDDYTGHDFKEEYTGEAEDSDDRHWLDTNGCIFKQEHILSLSKTTGRGVLEPETRNIESSPTADPPASSNVTAYAVGAGLVGLLVVGVIAMIAMKRRAKSKQSKAASHSGQNTAKDKKMNVHSGCTERLTHNDEYGA